MPIASWPLLADSTRYPLVASMNLSTDSSCSLSSTQRMIFLGLMIFGAHSFFQIVEARPEDTRSRSAFLRTCASGFHGLAAREHRLRGPISYLGKRRMREDPGGPAYTPSFPAVGDPKARTSRAAGYSKIRDNSG